MVNTSYIVIIIVDIYTFESSREDGKKRLKRYPADDLNPERVSKRRREDGGNNALSHHRTRASTAPTAVQDSSLTQRLPETAGHKGQLKRNCRDATDGGRAIKRRRHSGQTSNAAEPEPLSTQSERSEPDNSTAQVPPKPPKKTSQGIQEGAAKSKNRGPFT